MRFEKNTKNMHSSFLTSPDLSVTRAGCRWGPLHQYQACLYRSGFVYLWSLDPSSSSSIMTSLEGRREVLLYCSDTTTRHTTMCHRDFSLSPAVCVFLHLLLSSPPHCFLFSLHPCILSLFPFSSIPLSSFFPVLAHRPAAVSLVKRGLNEPWWLTATVSECVCVCVCVCVRSSI